MFACQNAQMFLFAHGQMKPSAAETWAGFQQSDSRQGSGVCLIMTLWDSWAVNKGPVINNLSLPAKARLQRVNILWKNLQIVQRAEDRGWVVVSWNEACVYSFLAEANANFVDCLQDILIPCIFYWHCTAKVLSRFSRTEEEKCDLCPTE